MWKTLDYRGIDCPEPLVKVVRELSRSSKDDVITVLTDIPNCVQAIKETIEVLEVAIIEVVEVGGYWELKIKVIKDL